MGLLLFAENMIIKYLTDLSAYVTSVIVVSIAALICLAGAQDGIHINGIPLLFICMSVAFLMQWIAFIPAYIWQTERFYDLTGSLTYLTVTGLAIFGKSMWGHSDIDIRSLLLALLITVWALRLGTFLFVRILKAGEDRRFKDLKSSLPIFLRTWTLQGLWVFLTSVSALTAISAITVHPVDITLYTGTAIWIFGFVFEVIADYQKSRFRANKDNVDQFIQAGLWSISRHPNYFGEITLWVGVTIIALPVLRGWQFVTLISPFFVFLLLTRVSGIPLLQARADEKWGHLQTYQKYQENTPALWPKFSPIKSEPESRSGN